MCNVISKKIGGVLGQGLAIIDDVDEPGDLDYLCYGMVASSCPAIRECFINNTAASYNLHRSEMTVGSNNIDENHPLCYATLVLQILIARKQCNKTIISIIMGVIVR